MNNTRFIVNSAGLMGIAKIITIPLYFLQAVILVRYWGVSARGEYAILTSFVQVPYVLLSFGLPSALLYFIKKYQTSLFEIMKLLFFHLVLCVLIIISVFLIPITETWIEKIIRNFQNTNYYLYVILVGFLSIFFNSILENYLIGKAKIIIISSIKVFRASISLLITFLVVSSYTIEIFKLVAFIFLIDLIISLISISYMLTFNSRRKDEYFPVVDFYKFGLKSAVHPIYPLSTNHGIVFISSMFLDTHSIGIWSIANSFSNFFISLLKPINSITFSSSIGEVKLKTDKILIDTSMVLIFCCTGVFALAYISVEPFIGFAFGESAVASTPFVLYLIPILLVQIVSGQISAVLLSKNFGLYLSFIYLLASCIVIWELMLFIPIFGILGIVYSLIGVRALVLVAMLAFYSYSERRKI